jgi:RES domain-containing protein
MAAGRAVSLWRIAKHTSEFSATDLSGRSARANGGRWNRKGQPLVYAATTIALATLETLAHLGGNIAIRNTFLVHITVPASLWKLRVTVRACDLPVTWVAEPPSSTTIDYGTRWLKEMTSPLLLVPSVMVPEEYNVLINPRWPKVGRIAAAVTRQFIYDPRLQNALTAKN